MKSAASILFALLRVAIGIALLVYLGRSGAIEWKSLLGLAAQWRLTMAGLLILLLDLVVTSWRLCVLLSPRGFHLPVTSSTRLTLIGIFFNACLPGATGGDLIKIYYAAEGNQGRRTEVGTIILLDRAVGLFAMLLWPLLAAPFFPGLVMSSAVLRALLWGAGLVVAGLLAAWLLFAWTNLKASAPARWAYRALPLGGYLERVVNTVHSYRGNGATLLAATGIALLAHTLSVAVILLCAVATNPAGAAWEMSLLIPLGFLANTLPTTPGGLGVGEAVFNQLFAIAGLTGGAEALLSWRVLTILLSLAGLAFYLQGRQRYVHTAEEIADPS